MDTHEREWLETDGLGGFAMGTVSTVRTRRYHGLLTAATLPPAGRMLLVAGVEAWLIGSGPDSLGHVPLSTHHYGDATLHPDGATRIAGFRAEPWPLWHYRLPGGVELHHEIVMAHGAPVVTLAWRAPTAPRGTRLHVRPLFAVRDFHTLHHENPAFHFEHVADDHGLLFRPYAGAPGVRALASGAFSHAPDWYRNFSYERERERGLDFREDLASPGLFTFELDVGEAVLSFAMDGPRARALLTGDARRAAMHLRERERERRAALGGPLDRAADQYLVERGGGKTVIAGYPWFGDWGRDTFIAMRGLCLATGRLDEARDILLEWAGAVDGGMLPNRFPDHGEAPEYNSVDAALWYCVAVDDWLAAAGNTAAAAAVRPRLEAAAAAIVAGYAHGTRYGIRVEADGLLRAGAHGVQLTWMDAKVGDWVVTPRIGKPVEIQALWLRALALAGRHEPRWLELAARARAAFAARFWSDEHGCLVDVVDGEDGAMDAAIRPNQIFALGGLGASLVDAARTRRALDLVERELWTPLGPRSLSPRHPAYARDYRGGVRERDGAYHQGTVWPWLAGAFVEAWLRARDFASDARAEARARFLAPLEAHLGDAGVGHVSEIADAEPPHTPRGCPFQAWSVGELLRIRRLLQS